MKILLIILIALSFASCRTITKVVTKTEYRDSIVYDHQKDSVYIYDKDSVYIYMSNDTVYNNKYVFRYKNKVKIDSFYVNKSVILKEPYEVRVVEEKAPTWAWDLLAFNVLLVIFGLYKIVR